MESQHYSAERAMQLNPDGPAYQVVPRENTGVSNFPGTIKNEALAWEVALNSQLEAGFAFVGTIQSRKHNPKETAFEDLLVFKKLPSKKTKEAS